MDRNATGLVFSHRSNMSKSGFMVIRDDVANSVGLLIMELN